MARTNAAILAIDRQIADYEKQIAALEAQADARREALKTIVAIRRDAALAVRKRKTKVEPAPTPPTQNP